MWNNNKTGNAQNRTGMKSDQKTKKQNLKAKYQENQQRRKRLAQDNAKRRKQKQRQFKQIEERKKRQEQNLLIKMKKDKEEAYLKYLRNNLNKINNQTKIITTVPSLYDKYEAKKRQQQILQAKQIKPTGKWKTNQKKKDQSNNLMGLDLDIQATKDLQKIKKFYQQQKKQQLRLIQGFQEEWNEQQLMKSNLLDSLDLDNNAVMNSKIISKGKQPLFQKQFKDMKSSKIFSSQADNLKQIIGYDSTYGQSSFWGNDKKIQKIEIINKQQKIKSEGFKKNKNNDKTGEQLTKELLQKKKETQLMGWVENIDQAEELFSNCTSNNSKKSFPRSQILNDLNKKLRKQKENEKKLQEQKESNKVTKVSNSKKQIEVIPQIISSIGNNQKNNVQKNVVKKNTIIIRKTPQKITDKIKSPGKVISIQSKSQNCRQTYNQQKPIKKQIKSNNTINDVGGKTIKTLPPKPQSKAVQKFKSKLTQNIIKDKQQKPFTNCTQQDIFNIQQFIKDDLNDINIKQKNLQQQIRDLHIQNKQKLKNIEQKYEVRTDYQTSKQLINNQQNIQKFKFYFTEDQLEQSILRLDQLLIRKQHSYQQNHLKTQAKQQNTPQFNGKQSKISMIDPLSQSNQLLMQVLKLAVNFNSENQVQSLEKIKQQLIKAKQIKKQQVIQQIIKAEQQNFNKIDKMDKIKQNMRQNANSNKTTYSQLKNRGKIASTKETQSIKKQSIQINTLNPPPAIGRWKKKTEIVEVVQQISNQKNESSQAVEKIQINEKLKNLLFD